MAESMADLDKVGERELTREARAAAVHASRPVPRPAAPTARDEAARRAGASGSSTFGKPIETTAPGAAPPSTPARPVVVVETPPPASNRGRGVSAERRELVGFLRQYPGTWVKYTPATEKTKLSAIVSAAKKAKGGFGPGFDARMVDGEAYFVYHGDQSESGGDA